MNVSDDIIYRLGSEGIRAIYSELGATPKKLHGEEWEAACPFCGDDSHFGFSVKSGLSKCLKCQGNKEGYNLITFVAARQGVSNGDAFKWLAARAGVELTQQNEAPKQERKKQTKVKEDKPGKVNTAIYQRVIELTSLDPADREAMKANRGFSDVTIDEFKFRTGGPHIRNLLPKLQEEFSSSELVASGVCNIINGSLQINKQLTDGQILIPYLDENGQAYHLRRHKLGFKGLPAQPYAKMLLRDRPEQIVLTEGEFKAAALYQWGIPALAEPGTSSFIGGENLDRFAAFLHEYEIKSVVVIFDSETKDNPALPNYKAKPEARYDTQTWAYVMARKLKKAGFATKVGWLPVEWQENGKVDFDSALAQGRTKEDIERVIAEAMEAEEFLRTLPEDVQKLVRRKANRHFTKESIERDYNRYIVQKNFGGRTIEESITNFVLNIKASYETAEGVVRYIELINEFGEKSAQHPLTTGDMAGVNEFKKFLFGKGNYIFKGSASDLNLIWEYEFARDTGDLIYMPDRIGFIESGLWLFGNLAIKDAQTYMPDEDGIFWIANRGYKPQSMQLVNSANEVITDAMPYLRQEKVDIQEVARRLRVTVGGYESNIGLGMVVATIFGHDIFKVYRFLPFLFAYGRAKSGKTTFLAWLMNMFGIETQGVTLPGGTTLAFITRQMSYHSNLASWFDEYRNDGDVAGRFDGQFRSAYNRQSAGKGTPTAFQTRSFVVRGSVFFSGEFLPKDAGMFSRIVPIQFSQYKRSDEYYEWINENCRSWSGFAYHLITNYEKYKPVILKRIDGMRKILAKERPKIDERIFGNWAIPAGAYCAAIEKDDDFIDWVIAACKDMRQTSENESAVNQFWDDVSVLVAKNELGSKEMRVFDGKLYFWLKGVHSTWAQNYQRENRKDATDRPSLLKYLEQEPYFLARERHTKLKGHQQRCVVVDVSKGTDTIKEIAINLEAQQSGPPESIDAEPV